MRCPAAFTDKITITGARERIAKKAYIRAKGYPSVPFDGAQERLKANAAWRVFELPCGHDDRVGLRNQAAEARFPVLASRDVVAVEERRKAGKFEPRHQFVGERGRIPPRIGDEDLELLHCAGVGHRLPETKVALIRDFFSLELMERGICVQTSSGHPVNSRLAIRGNLQN
jgi:hypothetical protein